MGEERGDVVVDGVMEGLCSERVLKIALFAVGG